MNSSEYIFAPKLLRIIDVTMHVLNVDHPTTHAWHDSSHSLTKIIANNNIVMTHDSEKKIVLKEDEEKGKK